MLEACLDSEAGGGVFAEDLAGAYIAPQRRNGLVAGLAHDDELADAVHRGLGDAARPERVAAEFLDLQSRSAGGAFEQLADRIGVQAAPGHMTVSSDGTEDGAFSNPGPVEPLAQRADRASVVACTEGQIWSPDTNDVKLLVAGDTTPRPMSHQPDNDFH